MTDLAVPIPPRFRWLKRLAIASAALVVVTIGTRLWWGWHAERKLNAMYADFATRGEPIRPEDFNAPPIPDDRNAAFYLGRAAAAVSTKFEVPAASSYEYPDALPYPARWHRMMDKAFPANAAVYPEARKARGLKAVNWGTQFSSPAANVRMGFLRGQRELANVLGDTAMYAHFHGNDSDALNYIADIRSISRAVDRSPSLISHLVAVGIDALAIHRLQTMAGGLTIRGEPGATPSAARRDEVTGLITDLLDEAPYGVGARSAAAAEQMKVVDYTVTYSRKSTLLKPMYLLDAASVPRRYAPIGQAMLQSSWPGVLAVPNFQRTRALPMRPTEFASQQMMPNYSRAAVNDHRIAFDRRVAAIALAMRLYKIDHAKYPAKLDDLVPTYLPAVPVDPFAPSGGPIRYILALNGTRPVAYSVDEDGLDQTLTEANLPPKVSWGWQGRVNDQHRDLSQWTSPNPPAPVDSSEAAEEQEKVAE